MEIKLKTILAGEGRETIIDEYGFLWDCLAAKAPHGILSATAKGVDGEAIQGFYKNGALFIVDLSDARKYFGSMNAENCRWQGMRPFD